MVLRLKRQTNGGTEMTKQETYDYLAGRGIRYKVTEHAAVFNMEKLNGVALPYPDCVANVAESGRFDRAHP